MTVDYLFPGTYSAAQLGAIAFIDYHEDRIELTPGFLSDGGGLLIKQGANRIPVPLATNPTPTTWTRVQRLNIRPADVPLLNFAAGGAAIQFGFYRMNSNDPGDPPITDLLGIDNFEVKVCR
jgi:hypothetical protein